MIGADIHVSPIQALDAAVRATLERVRSEAADGNVFSPEQAVSLLGQVARATLTDVSRTVKASPALVKGPSLSKAILKRVGGDEAKALRLMESKRFSRDKHRAKMKALAEGLPWPPLEGPYAGDLRPMQAMPYLKVKRAKDIQAELKDELGRHVTVRGGWRNPKTRRTPAVDPRRSVFHNAIICLEDGKRYTMLKRPLRTHFNMTPEQYKAKWGLPEHYPMTPPGYSELKRQAASKIGLGHRTAEFRQKKAKERQKVAA